MVELKGVGWSGEKLSFHDFVKAGYFSIITFATLGYGDIHPANTLARICVYVEAVLGYAMLGAFVAVMARKLTYT